MGETAKNPNSNPPWPLLTRFKLHLLSCARSDGAINRLLSRLLDLKSSAPATKLINATRVSTSDITVDTSRDIWFRLFVPDVVSTTISLPLIVYYHGGGFSSRSPDSRPFDNLCSHLSATVPAVVASVNYRLTPEHRYPCQYDDGFDALKFIAEQSHSILPAVTDLGKCFIGGDSAGGNIAHHVAVRVNKNPNQLGKLNVLGLLSLQPFFGGEERVESELELINAPVISVERTDRLWKMFLPDGADRNHPAAHVFGDEDMKNIEFPRVLVIQGGYDPLRDWQKKYAEWLKESGKEVEVIDYPNAFHGFYGFPEMAEFDLLVSDLGKFINKMIEFERVRQGNSESYCLRKNHEGLLTTFKPTNYGGSLQIMEQYHDIIA